MNVLQAMPDPNAEKDTFGMLNPDAKRFFNTKRSASKTLLKP